MYEKSFNMYKPFILTYFIQKKFSSADKKEKLYMAICFKQQKRIFKFSFRARSLEREKLFFVSLKEMRMKNEKHIQNTSSLFLLKATSD